MRWSYFVFVFVVFILVPSLYIYVALSGIPVSLPANPIPFYIYDGPAVRQIREACKGGEQWRANHGAEHEFLMALESHPWRVEQPEAALLFLVPMYMSSIFRKGCREEPEVLYPKLAAEIEATWYFRRFQGMDHMTLDTDFVGVHRMPSVVPQLKRIVRNFIFGHYLENGKAGWRCPVQVPTIPSATNEALYRVRQDWFTKPGIEEWMARPYQIMFQGMTTFEKPSHMNRRQAVVDLPHHFSPSILISNTDPDRYPPCEGGNLEGCYEEKNMTAYLERLWQTKFGLHLRGDDPHSFRFYDILAAGQIAIAASPGFEERVLPFQCDIPWDDFVIFVDSKKYTKNPVRAVRAALDSVDEKWVKNALMQQLRYQPQFLWELDPRLVSENTLRSAVRKCFTDDMLARVDLKRSDFPCLYRNRVQTAYESKIFHPIDPPITTPS